jgi:hypothetical protein
MFILPENNPDHLKSVFRGKSASLKAGNILLFQPEDRVPPSNRENPGGKFRRYGASPFAITYLPFISVKRYSGEVSGTRFPHRRAERGSSY